VPTDGPSTAAPSDGRVPRRGRLAGKRICLDPGHDAYWGVGATGTDRLGRVPVHPTEGIPLVEYELTLRVAYRLSGLLGQEGADVCVTRREDGTLQIAPYDFTGDGQVRPEGIAVGDGPERTQPRIDWANQFGAESLVSVHFNSLADRAVHGTEVYYSDTGPQAERGRDLAEHLLSALLDEIRAAGYPAISRGVRSDRYQRYPPDVQAAFQRYNAATIMSHGHDPNNCPDCQRIGVLGNNPMSLTPGTYVGALVEVEFLSNPDVVEDFLMRPDAVDIIARGLASGVLQYFHVA
jgi:N-acetylmuramoyl-L-alanine amidase